jgi:hypothetical protein
MNAPRWDFLLFMTSVAGAATPALGQTVVPDIGQASTAAQSAASIPNVSGMWTHPYLPGFEPPASGPGPVTNRSRKNGVSNNDQFVGDYMNPILKPEAAEIVKKHGEIALKGIRDGTFFRKLQFRCSSSRTRSPSSTFAIIKFGTCA